MHQKCIIFEETVKATGMTREQCERIMGTRTDKNALILGLLIGVCVFCQCLATLLDTNALLVVNDSKGSTMMISETLFGVFFEWRSWITGNLSSGKASVLVNGSPTSEFHFHCGLKQGDPLAPYLFLLVMESLHHSFSRVVEAGFFKGISFNGSINISHLFYADDAVFIGEWSSDNLSRVMHALHCFSLASGLKLNVHKSHLLGVGIPIDTVESVASSFSCSSMSTPFKYLGVTVGDNMARVSAWDDVVRKIKARLSNWKIKTLSIGGRLTLLKSVLGATPIFWMSIFKVPKSVLAYMESLLLSAKKFGGLGVSSFFALNRALLFKWAWRFISNDNSLWYRVISAIHGPNIQVRSYAPHSPWCAIIREIQNLKNKGVDLLSFCKKRVGNGIHTKFWHDVWLGDQKLSCVFPRLFALDEDKNCNVASKFHGSVEFSFRRAIRGGVESSQFSQLREMLDTVILSNMEDRWRWDLNGSGLFRVCDVRNYLDDFFLPKDDKGTRWVKYIPIKINVFAWRVSLDRLPTRVNLIRRDVQVPSPVCPICNSDDEDISHLLFRCSMAADIHRLICRWWDLSWAHIGSYAEWLSWFKDIRLGSKVKSFLEGVFYVSWWYIWTFRNKLLFAAIKPRKDVIFDDIISSSFTWCNARSKLSFTWDSWLQHPNLISL
ncbi:RNA-directed DNA polymerase, eukaryota [Tanacetum coccineum]